MKYACGVVFYNPSEENVNRISDLSKVFDVVLVFDNSPRNNQRCFDCSVYYSTGENEGLAKPYNKFISYCEENDVDFLCIQDQDSMLSVNDVNIIKNYIEQDYDDHTAIYAPSLYGKKTKNWAINSNSFLNIKVLRMNSLKYDENYFLDRLDADFCKTAVSKGLKIKVIETLTVKHCIGEGKKCEHNPVRHYYISKNRFYFNRKFYRAPKRWVLNVFQSVRHIALIGLREKNKIKKILACIRGWKDFRKMELYKG